ncbi:MAG: lipopolysaccharide biosynthesis protein [Gemmataceae bacterium]|nr:lipopolysaccharide biosynthesis protein [Gemmataceae bacterium]
MKHAVLTPTAPIAMEPPPAPRPASLRNNFAWTFAGNVVYAACQWGMLVVLAKFGDAEMVGRFSLALSITAPIFLFAGLNTRALQASDAKRDFTFSDYYSLRLIMVSLGLLATFAWAGFGRLDAVMASVLILIGVAKGIESIADVCYGALQHQERMKPIAVSMILKGALSLAVLALGVMMSGLQAGAFGLAAAWGVLWLVYDLPQTADALERGVRETVRPRSDRRTLLRLFRLAFPLGIVLFLLSLTTSLPRFFVERERGYAELGVFVALSYLMIAGTTVVNALGQSATPRLARHFAHGERREFFSLLTKLLGIGAFLGLGGLAIAAVIGRPLLTLLYRPEYGEHVELFLWLMAAAALQYLGSFLGYAITAARIIAPQVWLFAAVCGATSIGCWLWTPIYGAIGAAWALLLAGVVQLVGSALLLTIASAPGGEA